MKRFQLFSPGKKFALAAVIISGMLLLNQSCKKDDNTTAQATVSQDEAAEAVTQSLSAESGGMTDEYSRAEVVTGAQEGKLRCGESANASVTKTSAAGAPVSFTATVSWAWKFNCVTPANITFTSEGHIKYDAPRMSADDSSHSNFIITGIGAANEYDLNGTYTRNGFHQSKIGNKNSFTGSIIITSQDVKINKSTHMIDSGTATIAATGASSSGKSFSYAGTITFLGNKKATLVFAGGGTYNISW